MKKIQILPDQVIDQIAAGEIIERPSSVVKELVENSIDAGATGIIVEIEEGGKKFIRITDNGDGMTDENLGVCFKRFATSKIMETNDLERVDTYGFRGEALPSIASVSNMTIESCYKEEEEAHVVSVDGGKRGEVKPCVLTKGTRVSVSNLFYNVPARLKFLKKENTEKRKILSWIQAISLAHFKISFKLVADGKIVFECGVRNNAKERYLEIFGKELIEDVLFVKFPFKNGLIHGFISKPKLFKRDRSGIRSFVNGRLVQNKILNYAIFAFYKDKLMHGQFPYVALQLEINPKMVDVNVHPAKLEVRFRNEDEIVGCCIRAFNELYSRHVSENLKFEASEQVFEDKSSNYKIPSGMNALKSEVFGSNYQKTGYKKFEDQNFEVKKDNGFFENSSRGDITYHKDETRDSAVKLIGQAANKYLVVENADGISLFDQHASHERILYEKMIDRERDYKAIIQSLLIPQTIELPSEDFCMLEDNLDTLNSLGFSIEVFGKNTFKIDALPSDISGQNMKTYMQELALYLRDPLKGKPGTEKLIRGVCRQSVMFGDSLSEEEQKRLISDLFKCKTPTSCPHGRPTFFTLSWDEINRKLGRQ